MRPAAVMILAAGAGTRMKSSTPKVLHSIAGRSLVGHALAAAAHVNPERVVVVVRHERAAVAAHVSQIAPDTLLADQDDIPGTGRAVYCGLSVLDATALAAAAARGDREGDAMLTGTVIVTSGDVPLVNGALLQTLVAAHQNGRNAVTVLTAIVRTPKGYGRIIRDEAGDVTGIVEEKDATEAQRAITEINAGIYAFDAAALRDALGKLTQNNAQGELYLTDVLKHARDAGGAVRAVVAKNANAVEGVNDLVQLSKAAARLNARIVEHHQRAGVTIVDPTTTWIDVDVTIAPDATVLPGTQLQGSTSLAAHATVGPDTTLTNVHVGEGASVIRTHGSDSTIGADASVGPFSYLRPGTVVGKAGKIGAYVEVKNSTIGEGSKVPHLSYVGDAQIGEGSNIGAGTIVVNYDGVNKHRTVVGKHVRIGSDNTLIAPVSIGDGAYTGAGAIIRRDVEPGSLGLNSTAQQNVAGWVKRRRAGTPSAAAVEALEASGDAFDGLSSQAREERARAAEPDTKGEA